MLNNFKVSYTLVTPSYKTRGWEYITASTEQAARDKFHDILLERRGITNFQETALVIHDVVQVVFDPATSNFIPMEKKTDETEDAEPSGTS